MKGRTKKESGGAMTGSKEWEQDIKDAPDERNHAPKIFGAAKEKKRGGSAKHKHMGMVMGANAKGHAGRKPRKSGGRTGSNMNPLSSAHAGTPPKDHKEEDIS